MTQPLRMENELQAQPPNAAARMQVFEALDAQRPDGLQQALQQAGMAAGEMYAAAAAHLPRPVDAFSVRARRIEASCAPAQFCLLRGSTAILLVSGAETAELMARMSAGARQLRAQLQEIEAETAVGVGGCYAGADGLLHSYQQALHALGYAFSTGDTILFDPELRRAAGTLHADDCPTAASIDAALQSGSENRALSLTRTLFTAMRHKRVHLDECAPALQQLHTFILSRLSEDERRAAPAVLQPELGFGLEEVQLSYERLEGYLMQAQAQQNDTPAARCGRMATEYLCTHYMNSDLKLPELLRHLGVSRSYFSAAFKEKTGQSFVEYLTSLRMEKAKTYLRETNLCTYEIAERVGFADPHYFSLTFRRRTGLTPKQYRETEAPAP